MTAGAAKVSAGAARRAVSKTTSTSMTTPRCLSAVGVVACGRPRPSFRSRSRPLLPRQRVVASAAANAQAAGSDDVASSPTTASPPSSSPLSANSNSSSSSVSSRVPRRDWRPNAFQKNDDELHTLLNSFSPINGDSGNVLLTRAPPLPSTEDEEDEFDDSEEGFEVEEDAFSSRRASSFASSSSLSSSSSSRPPLGVPRGVSSRPRASSDASLPAEAFGSSPLWTPHPLSDEVDFEEGEENVAAAFGTEDDDDGAEEVEEEISATPASTTISPPSTEQQHKSLRTTTPVYVMLPLDTVWLPDDDDGSTNGTALLTRGSALEAALRALAAAGVTGVAVDVWWGIAEASGPGRYDFDAYARLFEAAAAAGLKVSATMSFHAAGGNVGDTCTVPLPPWVLEAGRKDPDMFYTDAAGHRNRECLSLGADDVACLPSALKKGTSVSAAAAGEDEFGDDLRTPVQAYSDFVSAFATRFRSILGTTITEVTVGLGPAGELRYPSYPEGDGRWRFPGVGAFQCYDANMKKSLAAAALAAGEPAWGHGAPHDAGWYNSSPWDAPFFAEHSRWDSDYGRFFLDWYSMSLASHADRVLGACRAALDAALAAQDGDSASTSSSEGGGGSRKKRRWHQKLLGLVGRGGGGEAGGANGAEVEGDTLPSSPSSLLSPSLSESPRRRRRRRPRLGAKLAGVHWWYGHPSHAAELTAGYYNVYHRCGYRPLLEVLARHGAAASLTCVEMRDCEHPPHAHCRPQALLDQVVAAAAAAGGDEREYSSSSSSSDEENEARKKKKRAVGVPLAGENALQRYDDAAASALVERASSLSQLTFLRMGDLMFDNWGAFAALLARLRVRE